MHHIIIGIVAAAALVAMLAVMSSDTAYAATGGKGTKDNGIGQTIEGVGVVTSKLTKADAATDPKKKSNGIGIRIDDSPSFKTTKPSTKLTPDKVESGSENSKSTKPSTKPIHQTEDSDSRMTTKQAPKPNQVPKSIIDIVQKEFPDSKIISGERITIKTKSPPRAIDDPTSADTQRGIEKKDIRGPYIVNLVRNDDKAVYLITVAVNETSGQITSPLNTLNNDGICGPHAHNPGHGVHWHVCEMVPWKWTPKG